MRWSWTGLLQRDGRWDIARLGLGDAVRSGLPLPSDISIGGRAVAGGPVDVLVAFSRGPSGEMFSAS